MHYRSVCYSFIRRPPGSSDVLWCKTQWQTREKYLMENLHHWRWWFVFNMNTLLYLKLKKKNIMQFKCNIRDTLATQMSSQYGKQSAKQRSFSFTIPTCRVCHSRCRVIWPNSNTVGRNQSLACLDPPSPESLRNCGALWQAPHLLTQGVSPGHAEVVTACALGRRGPSLTEYFTAR